MESMNSTRLWHNGGQTRIKICGVRCLDTALELADMGIDAIGLHLFRGRIDTIAIEKTAHIFYSLPLDVTKVLLTNLTDPHQISALVHNCGADTLQLQSHITPEALRQLNDLIPAVRIIKTLSANEVSDFRSFVEDYSEIAHAFDIAP